MQFLDTVTIFHKENDDTYNCKVVDGCYWYGDTRISNSGHGIVRDDAISIFFPKDVITDLKIFKNDRIVKGEVDTILSVNELSKYDEKITVLTVQKNNVGSILDNILVTGKWQM